MENKKFNHKKLLEGSPQVKSTEATPKCVDIPEDKGRIKHNRVDPEGNESLGKVNSNLSMTTVVTIST